ncbi:hypothetical protein HUJ04_011180 [Dendroctonus ponderosae]|nr:hypothetical protein HUJ04_011180 [Dendroctonus ponderosae]
MRERLKVPNRQFSALMICVLLNQLIAPSKETVVSTTVKSPSNVQVQNYSFRAELHSTSFLFFHFSTCSMVRSARRRRRLLEKNDCTEDAV